MKAAVRDRYGPPEVVRVEDVPAPDLHGAQVLVRVRAASESSSPSTLSINDAPMR